MHAHITLKVHYAQRCIFYDLEKHLLYKPVVRLFGGI